jgi:uncharacterized membrane protein YvlD (DUF360 family)
LPISCNMLKVITCNPLTYQVLGHFFYFISCITLHMVAEYAADHCKFTTSAVLSILLRCTAVTLWHQMMRTLCHRVQGSIS